MWRTGLVVAVIAGASLAQITQRVSVSAEGRQSNGPSARPALSADGRYIAFVSSASNLVPGDTNGCADVFVRDRVAGTTERVSVDANGIQAALESLDVAISADGRFVAFSSAASNLVPGDTNDAPDVFVRDRLLGTTERVSVDSNGAQADLASSLGGLSADGRRVVFASRATNLVPRDTNDAGDIFVRDRAAGTTERASLTSTGGEADDASFWPAISADGRVVSFSSRATNLVPRYTDDFVDVFVRDLRLGTTERISVGIHGHAADDDSFESSISGDGRFVAFTSRATNLLPLFFTNPTKNVFVRDRATGFNEIVSISMTDTLGWEDSGNPSITPDGLHVAFASDEFLLDQGDWNHVRDAFVRDRSSETTELVSRNAFGEVGNLGSGSPSISADGAYVAFESDATQIVPDDTNGSTDVFFRHRTGGMSFEVLCVPGVGGVIDCPCSNPPGGPDRGCDNSSVFGGATIHAWGGAYLSSDSLGFYAVGQVADAVQFFVQGSAPIASGRVYGQGVLCIAEPLLRMYTKSGPSRSIGVPNRAFGDRPVSLRSAELGSVIRAGESRYYAMCYRDPVVPGGCPPSSTFNVTQTVEVSWFP